MPTAAERVEGGLLGLLIGDALGVPYEFHPPASIPPHDQIEFEPPPGFSRAHAGVPPGTWSDDGAQALCLLDVLLQRGKLDPHAFAGRLLAWYRQGTFAVDGRVFDCGVQTSRALDGLARGMQPLAAGPDGERDNGNGSLMRVLPLALWHQGPDAALVADAMDQSRLTHGHARSTVCCALYCLWARRILEDDPDPWRSAVASLRASLSPGSIERIELDEVIRPDDPPRGMGSGYVLDALHSARMVVEAGGGFEQVVKSAVALGRDTDTTAAIAGGIAGLQYGVRAIPARWRLGLRGRELYEPLLVRLLARHGGA
jgi:ADP-ribosyl-[dinitrogen reductase] hydrolase